MIAFCRFPLKARKVHTISLCSCPLCWGLAQFCWRLLQGLPVTPAVPLEDPVVESQTFFKATGQWIIQALEAHNTPEEIIALLPSRFRAFRQKHLGYLDLFFYPTENFAHLDLYFPFIQQVLTRRLQASEASLHRLLRQSEATQEARISQWVEWSHRDYTLTLQTLWEHERRGDLQAPYAFL